jgi:hypothetical protein
MLAFALFGLCVTHQAVQRTDIFHVTFAAFASIGLLPASTAFLGTFRCNPVVRPRRSQALFAVFMTLAVVEASSPQLVSSFQENLQRSFSVTPENDSTVAYNGEKIPVSCAAEASDVAGVLDVVGKQATPGQRLFVGPGDLRRTNVNDTYLYHLLPQLTPASYFLEMNPGSANRPNSRLAADVASADWLILNRRWDVWPELNESQKNGSDVPMSVIRDQFEICKRGVFLDLYRRRQNVQP